MYIPVKIGALSRPQISRLLNEHGVKMKLGNAIEIHVSKMQAKKLERAHKKGSSVVITFDPYQISQHQHMRMKGKGTKLVDQAFTGNDVAKFLGAKQSSEPLMNKDISLNQVKEAGDRVKNFLGLGVKKRGAIHDGVVNSNAHKRGRPRKLKIQGAGVIDDINNFFRPIGSVMVHDVLPAAGGVLGGIAGAQLGPITSVAGATAGRVAGQKAAKEIAAKTGLGMMKKRGLPSVSKMGVGMGQKKKAGRPRKGAALMPAGY